MAAIVRRTDAFPILSSFCFLFRVIVAYDPDVSAGVKDGKAMLAGLDRENLWIIVLFVDPRLGVVLAAFEVAPVFDGGQNRVLIVLVELLERIPTEHLVVGVPVPLEAARRANVDIEVVAGPLHAPQ